MTIKMRQVLFLLKNVIAILWNYLWIILYILFLLPIIFLHNPTFLEMGHLPAGLLHLKYNEFSTCIVNPPLVRTYAAVPLYFMKTEERWRCYDTSPLSRSERSLGYDFILTNGRQTDTYYYLARIICLIFPVGCAFIIFHWAKKLWGKNSGYLSAFLWMSSPYILGHGTLLTAEVASASSGLLVMFLFSKWIDHPNYWRTIILGIVLGLAELIKFTNLLLYFIMILLMVLFSISKNQKNSQIKLTKMFLLFVSIIVISIFVINCGYNFRGTGKQLKDYTFYSIALGGQKMDKLGNIHEGNKFKGSLWGQIPVPFPNDYIQGIDIQKRDFETGLDTTYLRGTHARYGWWYYYLYALLIKTPLGVLCLFALAIFCSFFCDFNASWRDEMVILLPGIALLLFVSSQTGFSVHSRYVIPALPFFFIWMSKVAKCFTLRKRFLSITVSVLMTWSIFSSLWVYPHSISYFNELAAILPTPNELQAPQEPEGTLRFVSILNAGPRNGGRHLLDSNIDWGQDIFYLEKWCQKHPEVTEIHTAISGNYPLEQTKIPIKSTHPANNPQPGWYAISINYLYDREKQYRYFLNIKPVARAGYSIYIYHITSDDVNRIQQERIRKE